MYELVGLFNQMLDKNDLLIQAMHNSLTMLPTICGPPDTPARGG